MKLDSKNTVALVTYVNEPGLTASDKLLETALNKIGVSVFVYSWDDSAEWSKFDAIVLRSCWDYHQRPKEFERWIKDLKRQEIKLWNPVDLVRWNMHKTYLLDLEGKGVNIVPTIVLEKGSNVNLAALEEKDWSEIVVKPAIGASAYRIFRASIDENNLEHKINQLLKTNDLLIQPLMSEVRRVGEYSSIYFNNIYSHTVLKQPKAGDFRSNYEEGAVATLVEQEQSILEQLQKILVLIQPTPLYVRIDYLIQDSLAILMELELIEPSLYMDLYPPSAEIFAKELKNKLNKNERRF